MAIIILSNDMEIKVKESLSKVNYIWHMCKYQHKTLLEITGLNGRTVYLHPDNIVMVLDYEIDEAEK